MCIISDGSPEKCQAGPFYLGVYTVHHLPEDLEPFAIGYPPDIINELVGHDVGGGRKVDLSKVYTLIKPQDSKNCLNSNLFRRYSS